MRQLEAGAQTHGGPGLRRKYVVITGVGLGRPVVIRTAVRRLSAGPVRGRPGLLALRRLGPAAWAGAVAVVRALCAGTDVGTPEAVNEADDAGRADRRAAAEGGGTAEADEPEAAKGPGEVEAPKEAVGAEAAEGPAALGAAAPGAGEAGGWLAREARMFPPASCQGPGTPALTEWGKPPPTCSHPPAPKEPPIWA